MQSACSGFESDWAQDRRHWFSAHCTTASEGAFGAEQAEYLAKTDEDASQDSHRKFNQQCTSRHKREDAFRLRNIADTTTERDYDTHKFGSAI